MSQIQDRLESQVQAIPPDITVVRDPASPVAEAYRSLRSTVKFADIEPPVRSLLIADSSKSGRHSETAANLAAALALGGDDVVLLDANLRLPRLHQLFAVPNEPGLASWLSSGDGDHPIPLAQTVLSKLQLMPAGDRTKHGGVATAMDRLNSERCARLLTRLREEAAFVIVDAPPLPQAGDALALASRVDAVLLLVSAGKTKRAEAQRAKDALDRVGARVLGAVLTDVGRGWSFRR